MTTLIEYEGGKIFIISEIFSDLTHQAWLDVETNHIALGFLSSCSNARIMEQQA